MDKKQLKLLFSLGPFFHSMGSGRNPLYNIYSELLSAYGHVISMIWTTAQSHLQKLEIATRFTGTAENRPQDKFSLPPILFKIQSNYIFCNLIGDLKSESSSTPCDKKCHSEYQTFERVARD